MNATVEVYSVDRPGRPNVAVKVAAVEIPGTPGPVYTVTRGAEVIGTLTLRDSPSGRPRWYGHRNGDAAARVAHSRIDALRGILDREDRAATLARMAANREAREAEKAAAPKPAPAPPEKLDALRAEIADARQEYADADALREKAITRRRAAVAEALAAGLSQAECAELLGVSRQFVRKLAEEKP